MQNTYILGVNCIYHELSACLIKDGVLLAAVEEERFNRIKHGKTAEVNNPNIIPVKAIEYCLEKAGISWQDLSHIGISFFPKDRLKNINIDPYFKQGDWGSKKGEMEFYKKILTIPKLLSKAAGINVSQKVKWIPHHISHASSCYFVSPFKKSAVVSIDGIGEVTSTWIGLGHDNKLDVIKELAYPNSLGFLWEKFSKFLGFSEYDASKVMGLASYGNPERFRKQFQDIVHIGAEGEFSLDNSILQFRLDDYSPLEKLFGIKRLNNPTERTKKHEDLASALQEITNKAVLNICAYAAKQTKSSNLCLAGGVALNCVSNYEVMKSGNFKNIYIQPAANDAGSALGAAYYIWNHLLGGKRKFVMRASYWGPEFSRKEVEAALQAEGVKYEKPKDLAGVTAKLISQGNIIGWFQGRAEWGPRALGNRSLLADPRNKKINRILNLRIKKREPFRPFAPSVLAEDAAKWFDIPEGCKSLSLGFMEFTFPAKKDARAKIPAVVHVDGTSRIQTVSKEANAKYYSLIRNFKKQTGVPMVVNTSFNENEPIVCSPAEAIRTFKLTKMDYLVIGECLVSRGR